MPNPSPAAGDQLYSVGAPAVPASRKRMGRAILLAASVLLALAALVQVLYAAGLTSFGFNSWRPVLYAFLLWSVAVCVSQVLTRGEAGHRALFVLPAVLFTAALVIFPTFFGLYIAFTDWNLSGFAGRQFNGLDNVRQLINDPYYWNALRNMMFYV